MSKKVFLGLLVFALAMLIAVPAFAQEATPEATGEAGGPPPMPPLPEGAEVVAGGLNGPRQLTIASDGTIYVAEIGAGGELIVTTPEGDLPFGMTGQVSAVTADGATQFVGFLPSGAGSLGPAGVAVTDDAVWVVVNGNGPLPPPSLPLLASVAEFDRATGRLLAYADLYTYEATNNVDGNDIDSNPTAIEIGPDGTVYVIDTGANAIYSWSEDAGMAVWQVWPGNEVPTGIDFAADGSVYVSFLGTAVAPGAAMVQHLSAEGEILETFSGFTALTDVAVADDGTVYAVSLTSGFGEDGAPLPGQILSVGADGGTVVVDGLMLPYGIAIDADGSLLVTTGSAFLPPGTGMILRFHTGM